MSYPKNLSWVALFASIIILFSIPESFAEYNDEENKHLICPEDDELTSVTKSHSAHSLDVTHSPTNPKNGCSITLDISFKHKDNPSTLVHNVHFDILVYVTDENNNWIKSRSIANEQGKDYLFASSGQSHIETIIKEPKGDVRYAVFIFGSGPSDILISRAGYEIPIDIKIEDSVFKSPKQQFQEGIVPHEIICSENHVLIQKSNKSYPACVELETAIKLSSRNWTILDHVKVTNTFVGDITKANNQVAVDFYKNIAKNNNEDNNIFFSPWSITTAFALAYEGANGTTAEEIKHVFGFSSNDQERRSAFASMQNNLNEKDAKYDIQVANALWLAEDFEPFPEYVDISQTYYDSEVSTMDLTTSDGVDVVNDWVRVKTNDNIKKLLEPDSTNEFTRLVITNAIYFEGAWTTPFDKEYTKERDFSITENKTTQVPMMTFPDVTMFNTGTDNQLQILELPYVGDKISMLILLPDKKVGLQSIEESLSLEKIDEWRNNLYKQHLYVYLPKFTLETDYDLISISKELGISSAFDFETANFSKIVSPEKEILFIDQAIHKAFVDVNEEGTTAAAATGVSYSNESLPPVFNVDHPFMFIIQDNDTGNILFIGRIVNPLE